MKKIVCYMITFATLIFLISCATTPKKTSERPFVQRVIEIDKPSDELFELAAQWMSEYFKSEDKVIQSKDIEPHKIVGKGFFYYDTFTYRPSAKDGHGYGYEKDSYMCYSIVIETKDGKARFTFKDFLWKGSLYPVTFDYLRKEKEKKIKDFTDEAISNFESYILSQSTEW